MRNSVISATLRYLTRVVIMAVLFGFTAFVVLVIFRQQVKSLLYSLFGIQIAEWLMLNRWLVFGAAAGFLLVVLTVVSIAETYRSLALIQASLGKIMNVNEEIEGFPEELVGMEAALREVQQRIFMSNQAARDAEQQKNDLVVYLAHDLKTPLTSVVGYLSLLAESPDLPPQQRAKYTNIALDKAYRLESLINEFFDITRFNLHSLELERGQVDLSMLLRQIADEFFPLLEQKGLSLSAKIDPHLVLNGDADKLARVFDNLLRNAISYSYPDTTIELGAAHAGAWAVIIFRNRGNQITPEKMARIFEKFYRADASRGTASGGAGLGLAIVKQLVEVHGGSVEARSEPEYTDFIVRLPL